MSIRYLIALAVLVAVVPCRSHAVAGEPLTSDRVPPAPLQGLSLSQSNTTLTDNLAVSPGLQNSLLSQPPLLTGRYTLNGQRVLPYIGAGFGGGEPTDLNRTILRAGQDERILRDSLGKALMPNEFQLGVRIPF